MKKKKVIIIISIIVLLIVCIGIGSIFYVKSKELKVSIKKNIKVNINDNTYNTDYIKVLKKGNIIKKKEKIDT